IAVLSAVLGWPGGRLKHLRLFFLWASACLRAGGSAAAGEPDLLGGPASDPLVRVLRKVVVGGAWRPPDLDQVLHDEAAPGHDPDPFPVRQRELPVGGA